VKAFCISMASSSVQNFPLSLPHQPTSLQLQTSHIHSLHLATPSPTFNQPPPSTHINQPIKMQFTTIFTLLAGASVTLAAAIPGDSGYGSGSGSGSGGSGSGSGGSGGQDSPYCSSSTQKVACCGGSSSDPTSLLSGVLGGDCTLSGVLGSGQCSSGSPMCCETDQQVRFISTSYLSIDWLANMLCYTGPHQRQRPVRQGRWRLSAQQRLNIMDSICLDISELQGHSKIFNTVSAWWPVVDMDFGGGSNHCVLESLVFLGL
jgi:hypothetical protein